MSFIEKVKKIFKSTGNPKQNGFQQQHKLRPDLQKTINKEKQSSEIQIKIPGENSTKHQLPEQSEKDRQKEKNRLEKERLREARQIKKSQNKLLEEIKIFEEENIKRHEEAKRIEKEKMRRENEKKREVMRRKKAEVKRQEKEEERKRNQLIKKFEDSGTLQIIIKYAEKHPDNDIGTKEFGTLKQLLEKKGFTFNDDELQSVIHHKVIETTENNIKSKILFNNPENSEACIQNYLESFGDDVDTYKEILQKILKNTYKYKGNIDLDIEKIKKEVKLEKFESHLLANSVTIFNVDEMSGYDFEKFLKHLFKEMGYLVEHTPLSHDQGADLIVEKFGEKTVIQAKNQKNNVGNTAIQEVFTALPYYHAHQAIVISTSGFTEEAKKIARSTKVTLWDREKLIKVLEENPVCF